MALILTVAHFYQSIDGSIKESVMLLMVRVPGSISDTIGIIIEGLQGFVIKFQIWISLSQHFRKVKCIIDVCLTTFCCFLNTHRL